MLNKITLKSLTGKYSSECVTLCWIFKVTGVILGLLLILYTHKMAFPGKQIDYSTGETSVRYSIRKTENEISEKSNQRQNAALEESQSRKKIVLYTYMRGGSSFIGEIFNQNPDAAYFFEPIDGFYQGMLGMAPFTKPMNIIYYSNQTKRGFSELEAREMAHFHKNLMECNYENVPMTVFADYHNRKSTITLRSCGFGLEHATKCLSLLRGVCTGKYTRKNDPSTTNVYHAVKNQCLENIVKYRRGGTENSDIPFMKFVNCLREMTNLYTVNCKKVMESKCRSKHIQALKNIRLTMELVEKSMIDIPDLYMIFYVRDPRGILSSRVSLSALLTYKPSTEGKLICDRMLSDYNIYKDLEIKFPGRVLLVKYEDFAKFPIDEAKKIYDFIGEDMPIQVVNWIQRSTDGVKKSFAFGTTRSNSTAVSLSWRTKLDSSLKSEITDHCKQVIRELKYDMT